MKKDRVQLKNPRTENWVKINTKLGRIIGTKQDGKSWKNVIKKNPIN